MSLHTGFQVLHGDPHGPTHRDDRLEPDGLAMLRGKYLAKPADRSGHDHREADRAHHRAGHEAREREAETERGDHGPRGRRRHLNAFHAFTFRSGRRS